MQYENLSAFYDRLTDDQPYAQWLSMIQNTIPHPSLQRVLDIGCGTGTLTQHFTDFSNEVVGMDLSVEMLSLAKEKTSEVIWIEADMADFQLDTQYDLITILCDSLNYLADETAVLATFNNVYHHLAAEGHFIFDVHTAHKMTQLFNGQVYLDDREDLTLVWQTEPGDAPLSVWHDLTFFILDDQQKYIRRDESQYQRTFEKQHYIKLLRETGFTRIKTFYDFDEVNQNPESDRLFFIVQK
ncbi:class I SAM-dependent methyltransferase [Staphylococcus lutrae]|uniref:SAM-dependent methyltransferase n=2 Tax=Staphylococcus lutrae TaxID=155085 RepID=A0AAC9RQQ8_9STAP|nr:SAM-dependent methyltransferase [Staphylococcus lutrae]PNZ38624.1 class I SAM-dependent methyltransferase [Staphylococcus lutrae]